MRIHHFKSTFYLLLTVLGVAHSSFSQTYSFTFETKWDEDLNRCNPCAFDEIQQKVTSTHTTLLPVRGNNKFEYRIKEIQYKEVVFPSYYSVEALASSFSESVSFSKAREENYLQLTNEPLINQNGKIRLVEKISVEVTLISSTSNVNNRGATFASSSILANGSWFKIGVDASGAYKLDYDFLSSLGVNMTNLNPNHINIYGNHFPELPISNGAYRPDDLLKNAIHIEGDQDNNFGTSDYILFYATGPDVIKYSTTTENRRKNNQDSLSYYFIHIDGTDTPKRVSSTPSSTGAVTHTVTHYNESILYENNDRNLIKSGTDWLGDLFDIELSKTISLNLKDVNTAQPITFKTAYASLQKTGTASMEVLVNGIQRDNIASSNTGGSYTEGRKFSNEVIFNTSSSNLNVTLNWNRTAPASVAWLDYLMVNYRRNSTLATDQILIRDLLSVGAGNVAEYAVSGTNSNTFVWEVTDPSNASEVSGSQSGSTFTFAQNVDSMRTFVAFNQAQAYSAIPVGQINNQNLHALGQLDYLIVSHPTLLPQAERLANLHRELGLIVEVVDIQKVYNEFSGGMCDPVAIRWICKMFYDRAAGDVNLMPKYLCLFGDGTYDPLNRLQDNNYMIPTYNNVDGDSDIDYVDSYTSDDFFGILDDTESMSPADMMDVAVGRIPVTTLDEAEDVVNKIEHYMKFGSNFYSNTAGVQCDENGYSSTFGDWRNRLVLMADDENNGQFVIDCEQMSDTTEKLNPEMNIVKVYLDAYQQIVTSGGQRYPDVEEAIDQNIHKGALVFNYVGHGGETGLTLERALTYAMIEDWTNIDRLTVFISATCEFSRFDDPTRVSAGERTLTNPIGGAVALLTTTRLVYISLNSELVRNLYTVLFAEEGGEPLALGEIIRRTKNLTSATENKRNFALLGDPALKLGKPDPLIVTDSINQVSVTQPNDTLKALSLITVAGHVGDANGNVLSNYQGIVYPTVFDKRKIKNTLGQDPASPVRSYDVQNNIIYKGKSTVNNGFFEFSFVVPKDIDYAYGQGKISYYSNNQNSDSYGYDTAIVVGGINPNGVEDVTGPQIDLFLNDENFVNGGITNENPKLIAKVTDENGINTTGNGIGHDITLTIDGNTSDPIILNNFYEADLDTYKSGQVNFQLNDLSPGNHQLTFKVWDVNNNSSEQTLEFVVIEEQEIGIDHLLNYPNPFTTNTDFYFEHNQVCSSLDVKIEIFTVSGKLVKTLLENVNTISFRSEGINWDGRDEYGDKLGRGVYVYRLSIETPDGKKAEKLEKLVIL